MKALAVDACLRNGVRALERDDGLTLLRVVQDLANVVTGQRPDDHAALVLMRRAWSRPGLFDGGLGRYGWDLDERCARSTTCALRRGHGGDCDPRTERQRFRVLFSALDHGVPLDKIERAMRGGAR